MNRQTAGKYLNTLAEAGFLIKIKLGKTNFYINQPLYDLFLEGVPKAESADNITIITQKADPDVEPVHKNKKKEHEN